VFLLVFHQLLPLTFFRGTNIFSWRCNTLQHTDSSESRNRSLSVSLRKTPVCSLDNHACWRLMHQQKKLPSMARLCLSFDIYHFEIEELSFLTLWWDFRKEASFWHRFRLLILTQLSYLLFNILSAMAKSEEKNMFWILENGFCHCAAVLQTQVPKLCTALDLGLLYILTLGRCSKFVRKNNFLALRVCFPQALFEWWPQVCRVKTTCTKLPTNRFVSTTKISMKCVVNWIQIPNPTSKETFCRPPDFFVLSLFESKEIEAGNW